MSEGLIILCNNCFSNVTSCVESLYVDCEMYPKHILMENHLIGVTVLMVCIFLFGLIGNICVCVVIVRNIGMRTSTNYYLFNLAISDLLLLLFGLPHELWFYWNMYPDIFGDIMCKLRVFASDTTSYVSVLTVVAFSIERYIAICHPLHTCKSGLKRAATVIICIWIICIACAVPNTLSFSAIGRIQYPPNSGRLSSLSTVCGPKTSESLNIFLITMSVMFFFIPMFVIVLVYVRIGLCIRSRNKRTELTEMEGRVHSNGAAVRNSTAIKVLIAVMIAFFVCWAPYHYQRVWVFQMTPETQRRVFVSTGVLYYLSATVNPILYNIMSRRYRTAFKEMFLGIQRQDSTGSRMLTWQNIKRKFSKEPSTKSSII